ncbi:MAG: hypothetical protein QF438_04505 [Phycisphaerales bacterium]|jgi:hypothetical protein|nr:hypothetical protein [Phycisphaerales bacterium]MDP7190090.1 hypothetical protein [Phycisphaerales bacterium]MDP7519393.1 hypothetical protein [Phycisphaerales bacterium]HCA39982.1 hypothetical protein [Phycisphaerales bacterium]|tara:strand:+ start:2926 stop:3273 length:348 start_codon:yes stop_codon:yes gene_type:complete
MKTTAADTWGFIGALLIASAISFVLVRYIASGPSDGAESYLEALLEPPASAPAPAIVAVAPSVVSQKPAASGGTTTSTSPTVAAAPAASTSFVDTLRSGRTGRHSYDRSQLRANQ